MRPFVFSLLFAIVILQACDKKVERPIAIPEVSVVTARSSDLPLYVEYVGQAYGLSDVLIQARVQGLVTGMYFKEGSFVKAGDQLYTIDDLPYQAKVSEADGKLADATSELTRAKNDLARVVPLVESNALSKRDLDAATAAVNAAAGRVKAARSAKTNAEIELGFCRVVAPVSGIIGISDVREGDFVGSLNSKSLNTVSDITKMRIRFSISENDYIHFLKIIEKTGTADSLRQTKVDLYLSNGDKYPIPATFNLIERQINAATGSLTLEALVANNQGMLRPGQYLKVKFPSEMLQGAIMVPQRAVLQLQNMYQICLLNDSNKVEIKTIKTGPRIGENWVITEGVKAGDRVVLLGTKVIKPNTLVKPIMVVSDTTRLAK
jgi:membrane fusion protein (multidrug efflux system)